MVPELSIVFANSSVSSHGNYTLVMVDANVIGTNESSGQTRHWLVNGVTLTGASFYNNLRPVKSASQAIPSVQVLPR